jgi:hypothetical protein
VASGPLADSALPVSTITLVSPPQTMAGDLLLAQLVVWEYDETVPGVPPGWGIARNDTVTDGNNKITSWIFYQIASGSGPIPSSWNLGSSLYAAGVIGAWRGVSSSLTLFDFQVASATAAGQSPISLAAPSITPALNNELQVYFYGAQSNLAPTISEPAAITTRFNSASAKEGFTLAFGDLAAPPGGTASPTYPAMTNASLPGGLAVMTAQELLLRAGP